MCNLAKSFLIPRPPVPMRFPVLCWQSVELGGGVGGRDGTPKASPKLLAGPAQ